MKKLFCLTFCATREKGGFSLVEVIVAAAVLAISVVAVISVIRKGNDITYNDLHRRQARAIISSVLESEAYQYASYADLLPDSTSKNVTLDERSGLQGTLTIKILGTGTCSFNSVTIPVKKIIITISWNEQGAGTDRITIEKWLTPAM